MFGIDQFLYFASLADTGLRWVLMLIHSSSGHWQLFTAALVLLAGGNVEGDASSSTSSCSSISIELYLASLSSFPLSANCWASTGAEFSAGLVGFLTTSSYRNTCRSLPSSVPWAARAGFGSSEAGSRHAMDEGNRSLL